VAIPIGVLFAGALPEPKASSPLAGTGGQVAVTDFRSRLLASLDSLVIPPQTPPVEQTVSLDSGGLATLVVGAEVSAPPADEVPVVWPDPPLCIQLPAAGDRRPGAFGQVPVAPIAPPQSGGAGGEAAGGLAAPSASEGAGGEPSAGKSRPQGTRHQGVAGPEAPAPVIVVQPTRPAPLPGEAVPVAGAGLASNATHEPMPPSDVSATDDASPTEAPNSALGQVGLRSERQRHVSGGDDVPSVGLASGQPQAEPGAGQATAQADNLVAASAGQGARSATVSAAGTVESQSRKATQGPKAQRLERVAARSGQPVPCDPQPADEAATALGVGHPASVEPAAQRVASGGGGEVRVRPLGADALAWEQRRDVPGAIVGASAATVAQARTSGPDPEAPEVQEADAVGTNEPVEGVRRPVVGGSQVPAHAVRNSLPQGREPVEQSHRAEEPRGGEGTRPGQARLAHGGGSQELQAEGTTAPWGRRVREAAGAGREPWLGHARRFATRDIEDPAGTTGRARLERVALEGAGELAARARVETSQPVFEPGGREGEAVVVRLGELEETMPRLVVERARLAHRGEGAELRVRLYPPELGEIRVVFRCEGDELRGAVAVEREEVKAWVEGQAPRWQSELSEAGLRVARLDVALLGRGGASDHGAMAWDGGESPPWAGGPQLGEAPAAAFAQEAEPVEPEFGVNAAGSDGRLDYWA